MLRLTLKSLLSVCGNDGKDAEFSSCDRRLIEVVVPLRPFQAEAGAHKDQRMRHGSGSCQAGPPMSDGTA